MDASEARDFDESRLYLMDPITVTLTRPGTGQTATANYVQERTEARTESGGVAVLESVDATFNVWAVETGALGEVMKGDKVAKADGSVYTVVKVEKLAHGRRFRCGAKKDRQAP